MMYGVYFTDKNHGRVLVCATNDFYVAAAYVAQWNPERDPGMTINELLYISEIPEADVTKSPFELAGIETEEIGTIHENFNLEAYNPYLQYNKLRRKG